MKMKVILAFLAAALSVIGYCQAEDPALRKELEGFMASFDKTVNTNNKAGFFSMFAPDYVNVDKQGKRSDLAQFKAMVNGMWSQSKGVRSKTLVKNVRGNGNEAVAWCEEVMIWKQPNGNGKWVEMKMTSRWAESVRKTPTGWKFYYSQELPTNEPWDFKAGG